MGEVERVLQLAKDGKISKEDAVRLLGALSSSLKKLPESTWERLFAMMDEGMSAEALSQVLDAGEDEKRDSRRGSYAFSVGKDMGNWGKDIGGIVESALRKAGLASEHAAERARMHGNVRSGTRMIRIEIDSAAGDEVRVNIPLGLANFALKLIPKDAQRIMQEQGVDPVMLQEMLQADLPDGELINMSSAAGDEIRIKIS
jgi:hypothetical protein